MARPAKDQTVDLSAPVTLTMGVIERLVCPAGKQQAFLRDTLAPGLRVRVSSLGAKSFVFERKVGQTTVRRTIGDVRTVSIDSARDTARTAYIALSKGVDPFVQQQEEVAAIRTQASVDATTVAQAWAAYCEDRKHKWGDRHRADHDKMASAGGKKTNLGPKGSGFSKPGVLHALMSTRLVDLTPAKVEDWATNETKTRATQARLGARMLNAFIVWCDDHETYKGLVPRGAATVKTRRTREALGKARVKTDSIMREQLAVWFAAVQQSENTVAAACLQVLLLTGARPNEIRDMHWDDIDWKWKSLRIRDKVEGDRTIPLTPFVAHLLAGLPKRNEWVFSSGESKSGQIAAPNGQLVRVCKAACIPPVTPHGLRRSFKSLTEWLDIPAGVVAQLMGHKPSATAEKHYTVRPLDLLRIHHNKIEAWVLAQGGVKFQKSQKC